ncbi:hypothetical protein ACVWYH_000761 [Bradyrhizobium sp. GM24.11]
MQVAIERDGVVELVDAEAVLGKAGNVRAEQAAASGDDQPVVGQLLPGALRGSDLDDP